MKLKKKLLQNYLFAKSYEFFNRYLLTGQRRKRRNGMIKFYSQFIQKNDICFDIGANIGNRSDIFLQLGAKVIALEPQMEEYTFLKNRFSGNFTAINSAVGYEEGKGKIYFSNASTISSMSEEWISKVKAERFENYNWEEEGEVNVIPLERLFKVYGLPKFIKIDVEGYEYEIIRGLKQPVKYLSFEYTHPEYTDKAIQCITHLSRLGDAKYNIANFENMYFEFKDWIDEDALLRYFDTKRKERSLNGDIYVNYNI